jgi:hypothetical protein
VGAWRLGLEPVPDLTGSFLEFGMQYQTYPDDRITPWFSMATLPIRQGMYQLRSRHTQEIVEGLYAEGRWQIGLNGFFSPLKLHLSQFEWRGLAFDPGGQ